MTLFHCDVCNGEWQQPDHVVSFWHKCVERYSGDDALPRRRVPLDREERHIYWALADGLDPEELFRRG